MAVDLISEKKMNKTISHLGGVKAELRKEANIIADIANVRLAPHRKTGAAHITVSHGIVDYYVSLVDEAALSIEFGHYLGRQELGTRRRFVRGLHLFLEWYHDGLV